MAHEFFPASRKRALLAIYLDSLLFSALLTLFLCFFTGEVQLPTWQEFTAGPLMLLTRPLATPER
jgi:hypothetical protein